MISDSPYQTPQEKLDALLNAGKLSDEDYLQLSRALQGSAPPPRPQGAVGAVGVPMESTPLRRVFAEAQFNGLCAGLARRSKLDVLWVRLAVVAATLILTPFRGLGLFVPFGYLAVSGLTDWDDPERAAAFMKSGRPGLLVTAAGFFWILLPLLFSLLILPSVIEGYARAGQSVWSTSFQGTVAGRAIDCASEYRSIFRNAPLLMLCLAAASLAILRLVYVTTGNAAWRRGVAQLVLWGGGLWLSFLVFGCLLAP